MITFKIDQELYPFKSQYIKVRKGIHIHYVNEEKISEYEVHPSPIRSAIFNAGKTSRTNVGHFMARLLTDDMAWKKWKGQMPVIYNTAAIN